MEPLWSPVVATDGNQRQAGWKRSAATGLTNYSTFPQTESGADGAATITAYVG